MSVNKYRKIWIEKYGEIPLDLDGRSYHIHHIDRDRNNNSIENLKCLSPVDHFIEHFNAGEYHMAYAIAIKYLDKDEQNWFGGLSSLAKLAANTRNNAAIGFRNKELFNRIMKEQKRKIENRLFHLQKGDIQSRTNKRLVLSGKHNFQTNENKLRVKERNQRQLKDGTHPFKRPGFQSAIVQKRIKEGTFHLSTKEHSERMSNKNRLLVQSNQHPFQQEKICSFCGETGKGFGFHFKHGQYCLQNPNNKNIQCEYCGKLTHPAIYKRYHGLNCKKYPSTTSRKT